MNDFKPESISWEPASHEGANFITYRLAVTDDKQLVFKPTLVYRLFALAFLGCGLWLLYFLIYGEPAYRNGTQERWEDIAFLGLGVILCCGGIWMMFSQFNKIRFNASSETIKAKNVTIKFSDVTGVQLLKKLKRSTGTEGGSKRYYAYELNIVRDNGERIFLIAHSDKRSIEKDGRLISRFIGKALLSNI